MFNRRLQLITISGIKICIDLSWLLIAFLLSWTLATDYFPRADPSFSPTTYWIMGILGMLGLFTCILLHELGHALVAKHYKIPISQITLFLFGGVAEIKEEPRNPKVEFFVAIAGPIVTIILIGILFSITILSQKLHWPILIGAIINYLTLVNIALLLFNLIPAFPLDGGRVFRSALWAWSKDLGFATRIASRIGSAFGILLILLALLCFFTGNFLSGFWFLLIGLFLQRAASSSQLQSSLNQELRGEKVSKFMKKNPISVEKGISIQVLVEEYFYTSHHQLYPVVQKQKLIGSISLKEVKNIPQKHWEETLVESVMIPKSELQIVSPDSSALEALNLLQQADIPTLLVVDKEQLVGLLTAQDLFKLISLKLSLKE